jgi:hypothetical protein
MYPFSNSKIPQRVKVSSKLPYFVVLSQTFTAFSGSETTKLHSPFSYKKVPSMMICGMDSSWTRRS